MKNKDILNRTDVEIIVNNFYDKVMKDDLIGLMFEHVVWAKHLPLMYDFWDNVLFHTGNYTGNPMVKHILAHTRNPMTTAHFERWLMLFFVTVDESYVGNNATLIKERAKSIGTIMQIKLFGSSYEL